MKNDTKEKYLVYKITNLINQKIYFGITKCTLSKRWNEHKHNSVQAKKQSHLNKAIKKYGLTNFKMELIKECTSENEMYETEIFYIKTFNSNDRLIGYNNSKGGEKSSAGKRLSDKERKVISEYQKNRKREPWSAETKEKMREAALLNKSYLNLRKTSGHNKGKPAHNKREITLFDKDDNLIANFSSIQEAALKFDISLGTISNNLKGLSKTTKQGIWKYNN